MKKVKLLIGFCLFSWNYGGGIVLVHKSLSHETESWFCSSVKLSDGCAAPNRRPEAPVLLLLLPLGDGGAEKWVRSTCWCDWNGTWVGWWALSSQDLCSFSFGRCCILSVYGHALPRFCSAQESEVSSKIGTRVHSKLQGSTSRF